MNKTLVSLLLLSAAVCVTPASANYFSNARLGVNLNIGSAPNPKPAKRPFIAEAPYVTDTSRLHASRAGPGRFARGIAASNRGRGSARATAGHTPVRHLLRLRQVEPDGGS